MGMEIGQENHTDLREDTDARIQIVSALREVGKGDSSNYEKLLAEIYDVRIGDLSFETTIQLRVTTLSQAVSYINEREHGSLLNFVLGMSLWAHGPEMGDVLVEFVINLASSNGGCLVPCLDMLVRNFLPPSCGLPTFIDSISRRAFMKGFPREILLKQKDGHLARKDEVLPKVHYAIGKIVELVPLAALHLPSVVLQRMPHRIIDKEWNALYIQNMLQLESRFSGEFVSSRMLMAVVDRLIEIDVEIRWEDIIGEEDGSKGFVFDMDLSNEIEETEVDIFSVDSSFPGMEAVFQHAKSISTKKQSLGVVADKLDLLMDLTLQHLSKCCARDNDDTRLMQVFDTLIRSFQSTIIDTYKSKFTQFLIFYICSLAPTTCGSLFASTLCDLLMSKDRPTNSRMSAAAYLASFLARAKYLPSSTLSVSLRRLVDWCVNYKPRQIDKVSSTLLDAGSNNVFYAACQAVMYILCFRMKGLLESTQLLHELPLKQIICHESDPLKFCLPSVVEEFMKQARKAGLIKLSLLREVSKKLESQNSTSFGGINRLDMFFPFDPYLLRESDRFIRPNFTFWSAVQALDSDDENEDGRHIDGSYSDSESDLSIGSDDDEVIDNRSFVSADADFDDFEQSMHHMSITPSDGISLIPAAKLLGMGIHKEPVPLPPRLSPVPLPPRLSYYGV